ncbi:MAG: Hsp20/alpha crystallin family protein [Anaerolineae bacterium]|nr:Hsp20/alpha crystallin family protein [Anaerolineae bacterium]
MVSTTQRINLSDEPSDDPVDKEFALDAPYYAQQRVTQQWIVMHQANTWQPPTDVFELDDRLVVLVEIAGMRDGEFSVALQERRLAISGTRPRNVREGLAYHQMEVRYGRFHSEIILPWAVERDGVSAHYRDGFLRVELPRARNHQVHIVDVDGDNTDEAADA